MNVAPRLASPSWRGYTVPLVIGSITALYATLIVARQDMLVARTLLVPLFALYLVVTPSRLAFLRDWFGFVAAVTLFDAVRGGIYVLVQRGMRPVFSQYVIDIEAAIFQTPSVPSVIQASWRSPIADRLFLWLHGSHFLAFLVVGLTIWHFRREAFWKYQRTLIVLMTLGLIGYFLLPTVPPWLAARDGLIPPLEHVGFDQYASGPLSVAVAAFDTNPVAAMPSLHAAFPIALAVLVWQVFGWIRGMAFSVYATGMCLGIVYLGEHYATDILAGAVCAVVAVAAARWTRPPREKPLWLSVTVGVILTVLAYLVVLAATYARAS